MRITNLIGKIYQVISEDGLTIFFQGTKMECLEYFYNITTNKRI